ncbi:MAG: radical SAM protein [Bacteroides sp.]|nr:radical SAM protein [Bacteroides sp.]
MLRFVGRLFFDQIINTLRIRRKPRVIQMPITGRCNSRCVTCNVWKVKNNQDINPEELTRILAQPFFSKVSTIGINGGELTMIKDIEPIFDAVLSVKSLKNIHVISNGLIPEKLYSTLILLKSKANAKGVKVGLTLSIDGVGTVHDHTRGIPLAFQRSEKILKHFQENLDKYCDSFNIGCTVSNTNVPYIRETADYLKQYPFKVYYHLAVPNKRIHTFNDADYYVMKDERSRLLALEFFQSLNAETSIRKSPIDKFRAFANYYFLKTNGASRLAQCYYRFRDVTIDENLDLSYCATASDTIGSLIGTSASSLIRSPKGKEVNKRILTECASCVHYSDIPTIKGLFIFAYQIFKDRYMQGQQYKRF